jgi:hypothetical protein
VADPAHIVFSTIRHRFECEVCAAYVQVSFPCSARLLTKVGDEFVAEHRKCTAPSPQVVQPTAATGGDHDG